MSCGFSSLNELSVIFSSSYFSCCFALIPHSLSCLQTNFSDWKNLVRARRTRWRTKKIFRIVRNDMAWERERGKNIQNPRVIINCVLLFDFWFKRNKREKISICCASHDRSEIRYKNKIFSNFWCNSFKIMMKFPSVCFKKLIFICKSAKWDSCNMQGEIQF